MCTKTIFCIGKTVEDIDVTFKPRLNQQKPKCRDVTLNFNFRRHVFPCGTEKGNILKSLL